MRYCGIDVSARPSNQQLVTLHERRGEEGIELVATFYEPGTPEAVARTVEGFGTGSVVAVDAPSGHRLDLLAAGAPLRDELGLPRRTLRALAGLRRAALPPRPAPLSGARPRAAGRGVGALDARRLPGVRRARGARSLPPGGRAGAVSPAGEGALQAGRLCETYPDAIFCSLLGHRPPPKRTPWGLQQRIDVLRRRRVIDEDGGLWHRTLDELDACAAAYAAFALAVGRASWVGDPREGVIVLPVPELLDRYDPLPPPRRLALSG